MARTLQALGLRFAEANSFQRLKALKYSFDRAERSCALYLRPKNQNVDPQAAIPEAANKINLRLT